MASYNFGSSTISDIKKRKDQLWSFMASSETEGPFQVRDIERAQISASGQRL